MMEYEVGFRLQTGSELDSRSRRVQAENPLEAVNRILQRWENIVQITHVYTVMNYYDEEEMKSPQDIDPGRCIQEITVLLDK